MPRSVTETLEHHQAQCDDRYVRQRWLIGLLAGLLTSAALAGWYASDALSDVRAQERRIAELEARSRVLDSLTVWVPRIERTAIVTQEMLRRLGR